MDRYSKKVYKFLLSQPGHGFQSGFYDPPFDRSAYVDACEYLVRCGYARKIPHGYALTHEGVHKRELDIRNFWKNIFTRFVPGVIVGVLTAAAVNLISPHFQSLLSELFQSLKTLL